MFNVTSSLPVQASNGCGFEAGFSPASLTTSYIGRNVTAMDVCGRRSVSFGLTTVTSPPLPAVAGVVTS